MATVAIRIDMPPKGELEISGNGSNPTEDQMNEELQVRQEFLDYVTPRLAELPQRPLRRFGNVSRVELHGGNVWSELNHYHVLLTVDIGIPPALNAIAPADAEMTILGPFEALQVWPEIRASAAA